MRIIKPGREPKQEIEQTCERCGCVFAYGREDAKCVVRVGAYVICPHCDQTIRVEPWNGY